MQAERTKQEIEKVNDMLSHDREFRSRVRQLDPDALAEIGYEPLPGAGEPLEFKVVTSTQDTVYIPMPPPMPEESEISLEDLGRISAGNCASTAASASTISTTVGCISSASTSGCKGRSADNNP